LTLAQITAGKSVGAMNVAGGSGRHPYGEVPVFGGDVARRLHRRTWWRCVLDGRLSGPESGRGRADRSNGAILVRNRTFGGDDPYKGREGEGEAFGGGWDGPQFVLTHRPPDEAIPGVTFVGDIDTAISESRSAAGDKYVNVLGASVAAQCLAAGALDGVMVCVTPVLLGDGTRLFAHPGGKTVRLNQISVSHTPQVTNLRYRVVTA
jgi:RibD C-terminal domain